ncbi:type I restriction-modification system subunit M [Weissella paramesenteroides]|uniref:type I restriction-modification system subunit M n=1 Tax=Weissella paramesenteroides TaxID=1249 RepID=UPI0011271A06|nr:type I restriction-modification system subunit M [Weissella paramesenteroides]MBU7556064.1 type I restriction-modification system subunit M [Weissella paramesenteroides]TPF03680.1 type I restriction-modification system subunit M [Weissella paramesenteroides]
MSETHTVQATQQAELQRKLWAIANDLRGNMDASEFRNYILGLIFYRFLSDGVSAYAKELLVNDDITFAEAYADEEMRDDLVDDITEAMGFFVAPEFLFETLVADAQAGRFDVEKLQTAVNAVQSSTIGEESEEDFRGLFDDLDLNSTRLGNTVAERSALMQKVLLNLADLDMGHDEVQIDVLGDAYEYLIGQFAANAGKKAGEFYTPQQVSKLLAQIVTKGHDTLQNVYDPTMGSGSLLLRIGDYATVGNYYGQELNRTTYNLGRMNLLMHGVSYNQFSVQQGDTLENDYFEGQQFDAVVANPPYSAKWNTDGKLDDERFRKYGKTAPKSKADFAFVEHMLAHLNVTGTMAVVLPHGVLFRGAAEGTIRRYMIEQDNVLDAVIGLPANLFFGTSIPTTVLVFKKNRSNQDVFFIDASADFEKGKNQNNLTDTQLARIVDTYDKREDVEKYAHLASRDEIIENDFNLNIPRYVDTFEEEEPIDLAATQKEIEETDAKIAKLTAEFEAMVAELVETGEE